MRTWTLAMRTVDVGDESVDVGDENVGMARENVDVGDENVDAAMRASTLAMSFSEGRALPALDGLNVEIEAASMVLSLR